MWIFLVALTNFSFKCSIACQSLNKYIKAGIWKRELRVIWKLSTNIFILSGSINSKISQYIEAKKELETTQRISQVLRREYPV